MKISDNWEFEKLYKIIMGHLHNVKINNKTNFIFLDSFHVKS